MDIRDLFLLRDVMQAGSFAAAARTRDIDPSLVSRTVSRLEAELGLRLFFRTTRQVVPTEAGRQFLDQAIAHAEGIEQARQSSLDLSSGVEGHLRLTASVGFMQVCILPLVPAFRALYPRLDLSLIANDATLDLAAEAIDLAIRLSPRPEGDLVVSKLFDVRFRVVASPDWVARNPLSAPGELSLTDCITYALPGYRSRWLFRDKTGAEEVVEIKARLSASSSLAVRELVLAGQGPALMADWSVVDALASGQLVDLFPDVEATATGFTSAAWLVYPSRRFLPAKTRLAVDFLREKLGRRA